MENTPIATQGYTHVYTGDGKGKTCAAVGLAVRAAGAGYRVYIGQFLKQEPSAEIRVLRDHIPEIDCHTYGCGGLITPPPSPEERAAAQEGCRQFRDVLVSATYAVCIADEILSALALDVLALDDVLDIIEARPRGIELVLTGRRAPHAVIDRADLVTDLRKVKHYYDVGVPARPGIEF